MESGFKKVGMLMVSFLLIFSATFAAAQGISTGTISGTVVDKNQAVVVGAKVTAVQAETNGKVETISNSTGAYRLSNLPIGTYTVTIEAASYSKAIIKNVAVSAGGNNALGAQALAVGSETTEVDVQGTAPLVESTTSQ